jgi:hypothetical protein
MFDAPGYLVHIFTSFFVSSWEERVHGLKVGAPPKLYGEILTPKVMSR